MLQTRIRSRHRIFQSVLINCVMRKHYSQWRRSLLLSRDCLTIVCCAAVVIALSPSAFAAPITDDQSGETPPCQSGQVVVGALPAVAASTHRAVPLTFTLAPGAGPCVLVGYPGVDSGTGGPLIHAERTPRGFLGGLPSTFDEPPTVTLLPSGQAQAVVEGRATDAGGNQCPTYTGLRVTPPNTDQPFTVVTSIDACQLQVHPVTES